MWYVWMNNFEQLENIVFLTISSGILYPKNLKGSKMFIIQGTTGEFCYCLKDLLKRKSHEIFANYSN